MLIEKTIKKKSLRKNIISQINITPLVDVMLVLLIIFIITSSNILNNISINLPKTESNQSTTLQDIKIILSIDKNNQIYLLDKQILRANLITELEQLLKNNKDKRIIIKGDANIIYGNIIDILFELQTAGFNKMVLISDVK